MNPAEEFLGFSPDRRKNLIEEAATRRSIDSIIMEKDFWVCWLLALLFTDKEIAPHLVFKGGTSLSKVFNVINRFSEDIDLSVSPEFVEANVRAYEEATSRTKRDEAMFAMQAQCAKKVRESIQPRLEAKITEYLGAKPEGSWLTYEEIPPAGSPNLYFHFPQAGDKKLPYIKPAVTLEMGSITDQQPLGKHKVVPWIADMIPQAFSNWACEVTALELPRTFWEKATILHSEYHRPEEQAMPDRYARHYYDFAQLLKHGDAPAIMADKKLAQRVAQWKAKVFPRKWANYDTAAHGTFQLAPPKGRVKALEDDYEKMRPFFLREPPTFGQLLEDISAAETLLNQM